MAHAPFELKAFDWDEYNLINYREFMQALRYAKDTIQFLPRTLSFQDVLESQPEFLQYKITDIAQDDFYMFRYEIYSLMKKH